VIHCFYLYALIRAYRIADLSAAYPVLRGTAPLITALVTLGFLRESATISQIAGIALIGAAMFVMIAGRHIGAGKIKALMLMNLVWIGWLFGDLIFSNEKLPASWWYSTFCTLPFFLACYWLCYCRPAREIVRYALGMAALAFLLLWFNNSGASTYMIFCCAYLGFAPTARRAMAYVLLTVACFSIATQLKHWPVAVTVTMCFIAITVGLGNSFYRLNWQREAELKLSHEEVRRLAATAERERIGRDLHDLLGHTLSLITLKLELSRRLFDRDPTAARVEVELEVHEPVEDAMIEVYFYSIFGNIHSHFSTEIDGPRLNLEKGRCIVEFNCPQLPFEVAAFNIESGIKHRGSSFNEHIDYKRTGSINITRGKPIHGVFHTPHTWTVRSISA